MRTPLKRVSFERDHEAARLAINAWVAARTDDRIRKLLAETDVTDETRAALVAAAYWKGRWEQPF